MKSFSISRTNNQKTSVIIFVLCFLFIIAYSEPSQGECEFKILWASDNQHKYEGKQITIKTAVDSPVIDNMRNIQYTIIQANPLNACKPFQNIDLPEIFLAAVDGDESQCSIYRKIENVKNSGAKGIIILKEQGNILIPRQQSSSSKFLFFLATNSYSIQVLKNCKELFGSLSSKNVIDYTKSRVQVWVSSLQPKSYTLLKYLNQTFEKIPQIANKIKWKPRNALWSCQSSTSQFEKCLNNQQYMQSCACSGQFCSPEKYLQSADIVVKEDIRQKIIFNNYKSKYFEYIKQFQKKCLKEFRKTMYVEDCATRIMNSLNLNSSDIHNKVQLFTEQCKGSLFQQMLLDRNRFLQIGYYPALLVDRQQVNFQNQRDLQIKLCRLLLLEKKQNCSNVISNNKFVYVTTHVLIPIIITFGLLILIIVFAKYYKKKLGRSMDKQVRMQVQASVANYFTLTQSK